MKDIALWLRGIEDQAFRLYSDAAELFSEDTGLHKFMKKIAADEAIHYHVMSSAVDYLKTNEVKAPAVEVDEQTKMKIENRLQNSISNLKNRTLTRESLLECVLDIEFSEWNHIFVYIIDTLKKECREFIPPITRIQQHKRYIEKFMEKTEYGAEKLNMLKNLPKLWEEKILVVDDEPTIRDLLQAILEEDAHVDTAENGAQGLKMLGNDYYRVIISDVRMPVLDGIEFYRKAAEKYNDINQRFVFFSGYMDENKKNFIQDHNLQYLQKPVRINVIKEMVEKIMNSDK